jgi:hypothetical protein
MLSASGIALAAPPPAAPGVSPAAVVVKKRVTAPPTATLTWTNVTTYSDGTTIPSTVTVTYNIYQGPSATALVKVATGVTALTDSITTGLVDGQTYYFAVTAVAGGLEGAQSNVGSKTFAAVAPGTTTLTVN